MKSISVAQIVMGASVLIGGATVAKTGYDLAHRVDTVTLQDGYSYDVETFTAGDHRTCSIRPDSESGKSAWSDTTGVDHITYEGSNAQLHPTGHVHASSLETAEMMCHQTHRWGDSSSNRVTAHPLPAGSAAVVMEDARTAPLQYLTPGHYDVRVWAGGGDRRFCTIQPSTFPEALAWSLGTGHDVVTYAGTGPTMQNIAPLNGYSVGSLQAAQTICQHPGYANE